jgi:cytochrome P450 family 110
MKLPNISKSPKILQRLEWVTDFKGSFERRAAKFGDTFTVNLGAEPIVVLSHPKAVEQLYTTNPSKFSMSPTLYKVALPIAGARSISQVDGEAHRRSRRLLMPAFHNKTIQTHSELICELTSEEMQKWSMGETKVMSDVLKKISIKTIVKCVFGITSGTRYEKLLSVLADLEGGKAFPMGIWILYFDFLQKDLGEWSPWAKFLNFKKGMDDLIYAEVEERRANPNDDSRADILNMMLSARDEEGQGMPDEELRDNLVALLNGGHSTTVASIAWTLHFIHSIPEVKAKLLAELKTLNSPAEAASTEKAPYLHAVCQEAIRLYPPSLISLLRVLKEPIQIMDYKFEPGVALTASMYLTHRRPDLFPEPEKFKPERFLERKFSNFEYHPFGGGNRMCIGFTLAQLEMRLIVATIMKSWELELASDQPVKFANRAFSGIRPACGIPMVMKKQNRAVVTSR